jgi:hypothetical protein
MLSRMMVGGGNSAPQSKYLGFRELSGISEAAICTVLIKTVSSRLKIWGVYTGDFWEWRE